MTDQPARLWASKITGHGKVDPRTLVAHALNWRAHPENQRAALAGTIDDIGFWRSVTVNRNSGCIVDGHLRVALAIEQNQPEIDVEWVDLTEDEERKALATGDAIAGAAAVNRERLDQLLRSIDAANPATQEFLANFARKQGLYIDTLLKPAGDPEPKPHLAAQLQQKWGTRQGQMWILPSERLPGQEHRLLVADSTAWGNIDALMGEGPSWRERGMHLSTTSHADMVFTDPPYGVDYVGKTRDALTIANDALGHDGTRRLISDAAAAWPLKPGGVFYVCSPAGDMEIAFRSALETALLIGINQHLTLRQSLVWVKQHFVMGRADFHWRHEWLLYGWADGAPHYFAGDRTEDTILLDEEPDLKAMSKTDLVALIKKLRRQRTDSVWHEDRPSASVLHPTTKPLPLIRKAIMLSTRPGEVIFDGFCGSGQTLVAAEQTGRIARVMDNDPMYAAVTLEMAHDLGLTPVLEDAEVPA